MCARWPGVLASRVSQVTSGASSASARATCMASYAVTVSCSFHARVRRLRWGRRWRLKSARSQSPRPLGQVTPRRSGPGVGGPESLQRPPGGAKDSPGSRKRRASTLVPSGVCRRNSRRAEASTTITRPALLTYDHRGRRLQPHALSTVDSGQRLVARRSRAQTSKFGQQVIGQRLGFLDLNALSPCVLIRGPRERSPSDGAHQCFAPVRERNESREPAIVK